MRPRPVHLKKPFLKQIIADFGAACQTRQSQPMQRFVAEAAATDFPT
jgi:hypothetical protein